MSKLPIIAIVGRPNVGKSSLFNRLIHKRYAITSDVSGTTRDRIYYHTEIEDIEAILVDTGGIEYGKKENIEADVQTQAKLAIQEADLIIFVTDATEYLTANDYEAAKILRKSDKKIVLIANKYDHPGFEENVSSFVELGFGEPLRISTIHKRGLEDVEEKLKKDLKKLKFKAAKKKEIDLDHRINICFAGCPNVGKSSLVNALLGQKKLIVSDIPGTTRDSTDTKIEWENHKFNLIDTAGLRRRGKIEKGLEKLSSFRALESIEKTDIACLVLDYQRGIAKQDMHMSAYITDSNKGLILVVNKSDLIEDETEKNRFINMLRYKFDFLPWAPVIFVSALKTTHVSKILELAVQIQQERVKQISNDELLGFMKEITHKHLPPSIGIKTPKFFELKQTDVNPPTFTFWINDERALHFSYRRYLENEIRKRYGFIGTSIKLIFKKQRL